MRMHKLSELNIGESAVITEVNSTGKMKRRLSDMGVTAGAVITFIRRAPLGDPLEFSILDYNLCLRKSETDNILIERI